MTPDYLAITGTLRTKTPLHVGTGNGLSITDAIVRRNAAGKLVVPGSSLAGVMRSIAMKIAPRLKTEQPDRPILCLALDNSLADDEKRKRLCKCLVCRLFGYRFLPPDDGVEIPAHPSRLFIHDAIVNNDYQVTIRDMVGIDRKDGVSSADTRTKFDLESVCPGTEFLVRIECYDELSGDEQQLLACVLCELKSNRAFVGGRTSRGFGSVALEDIRFVRRNLRQHQALLSYLRSDQPWETEDQTATISDWDVSKASIARSVVTPAPDNKNVARSFLDVRLDLCGQGQWLVNDPDVARLSGTDHAPMLVRYSKGATPVLPGSSVRGAIRSHAERLARTLATTRICREKKSDSESEAAFRGICPACHPLQSDPNRPLTSCDERLKRKKSQLDPSERADLDADVRREVSNEPAAGQLHFCLACQLFGSTERGSKLKIEDALGEGDESKVKLQDFLAIDRFTGGGLDGAKFDAIGLLNPSFKVRLFMENPELWQVGWLILVLRDIHDGLRTIGYGGAKGYGTVRIDRVSLELGFVEPADVPVPDTLTGIYDPVLNRAIDSSGIYQSVKLDFENRKPGDIPRMWFGLAESCVDAFVNRIAGDQIGFGWAEQMVPARDAYFDCAGTAKGDLTLPKLYGPSSEAKVQQ